MPEVNNPASAEGLSFTLDDAYNDGNTIDVDGDAVTLTVSDTDNNVVLILNQNDVTNNPNGLELNNAGTGIDLVITNTDTGALGAKIDLVHTATGSAAPLDVVGQITAQGLDDGDNAQDYARINFVSDVVTDGNEAGSVAFFVANGSGTLTQAGDFLFTGSNAALRVGDNAAAGIVSSLGDQDLQLQTGNSTTGSITITDGANGDIAITPDGNGQIVFGNASTQAMITTPDAQDLVLNTNTGTDSSSIRIVDGANGNIEVNMDGAGEFEVIGGYAGGAGEPLLFMTELDITSGTQSAQIRAAQDRLLFSGSSVQSGTLAAGADARGSDAAVSWGSTGTADEISGFAGFVEIESGTANGTITTANGVIGFFGHAGTGTVTTAKGLVGTASYFAAGTTTTTVLGDFNVSDFSGAAHTWGAFKGVRIFDGGQALTSTNGTTAIEIGALSDGGTNNIGLDIGAVSGASGSNWAIRTSTGAILAGDAIHFTQVDGNEQIDSQADGYLDYTVTTGHRFRMSAADTDVRLEFIGTTNSGLLEWMEDEDEFKFSDKIDATTNSIRIKRSTANVSDPPTDAELDSAFGAPSTVGEGFIGIIDDNDAGADGDVWFCTTTGTDGEWFYLSMTKAV